MAFFQQGALIEPLLLVTASGGTTTLTASSKSRIRITGSVGHTIQLPDATTLKASRFFKIYNRTSFVVNILDNGSNQIAQIAGNSSGEFRVTDISTTNGTWDVDFGGGTGSGNTVISTVADPTIYMNGMSWHLDNGMDIVTATSSGSLDSTTTSVAIQLNADTILGSSPTDNTTYYLYIDRTTLADAVTLTDNGRKVQRVWNESHFKLLTTTPDTTNSYRYVPCGFLHSATSGTVWSGTGSAFGEIPLRHHELLAASIYPYETYTTITPNSATTYTLSHGLSGEPQIVELYFKENSTGNKYPLDLSFITNKTSANLYLDFTALTFNSGDYVEVKAIYMPSIANNITTQSTTYRSGWISTTPAYVTHNLSNMDDIASLSIVEWNTTANTRQLIDPTSIITGFDATTIYLDWTGFTPSSTLMYQIYSGATALASALPTYLGGYTKWVGYGPGSYSTLQSAVTNLVPGDNVLVNASTTLTSTLNIAANDVKLTFMPSAHVSVSTSAIYTDTAIGNRISLKLKSDGSVWSVGANNFGQLGDGTSVGKSSPVSVIGGHSFTAIDAYQTHVAALKADGTVWMWGANSEGQLGDGTTVSKSSPVSVIGGHSFIAVSTGSGIAAGLKSNGAIWAWGLNTGGQLGDGTTVGKSSPVSVIGNYSFASLAVGDNIVGLKSDGTVWSWGLNANGQLGDGTTVGKSSPVSVIGGHSFTQVKAGNYHVTALKATGTVFGWGYNYQGKLGDGTTADKSSPVSVVGTHSFASIYRGYSNGIALKVDGSAWMWGNGLNGELGDNTTASKSSPNSVTGGHSFIDVLCGASSSTLALKADGSTWMWGSNTYNEYGDLTTSSRKIPNVSAPSGITLTGNDIHLEKLDIIATTYTDSAVTVLGNDCTIDKAKVTENDTYLNNAYNIASGANRALVVGSVQTTTGTITNKVNDQGTNTDYSVRG